MMDKLGSMLRPISLGIVAENKKRGTNEVKIWPVEMLPTLVGEVTTESVTRKAKGVRNDKDASPYAVEVKMSAVIPATWIGETNRATSPDVRRGEQVMVYQAGNQETYYWQSMGRDDNLRRLETVVYMFNANPSNDDAELSRDNCTVIEYNAHEKHITMTTSMANGEPCTYTHQFNTGDGQWTLEDSIGNYFHLDSVEHIIDFYNASESRFTMDKTIINVYSKDEINFETTLWTLKCETMNIDATTINTNANTINYKASNYNITAQTKHVGNIAVTGSVSISGGLSVGAGGASAMVSPVSYSIGGETPIMLQSLSSGSGNTINNGLTVNGDLEVSGNVNVPNLNCDTINGIAIALYLRDT